MKALPLFLLGTTLTLSHHLPAEEQHSHDAHEHGHGQLNLALDGQQLLIEFQAPAADLVGFEKTATTAQEKQHYAKALARLRQGATLFTLPAEAACTLKEQQVGAHADGETASGETSHQGHEEHDKHDQHEAHDESGHSDIHAEYHFECKEPQKLTSLAVTLFAAYPSLEKLSVQTILPDTPSSIELTPANPTLRW